MDRDERQVIDELFEKVRLAERQSPPRDPAAEALIQEHLAGQPAAPYYMAQAIVFQEEALRQAQQRLSELESELAARPAGGGFLAGLFGAGAPGSAGAPPPPGRASRLAAYQNRSGPSFLGGAMQTAVGIAGGVMLGSFLASMITGGGASAAEAAPGELPPEGWDEASYDDGGYDDGGGSDFDDGGGFDF